jgi:hypothetical protein
MESQSLIQITNLPIINDTNFPNFISSNLQDICQCSNEHAG